MGIQGNHFLFFFFFPKEEQERKRRYGVAFVLSSLRYIPTREYPSYYHEILRQRRDIRAKFGVFGLLMGIFSTEFKMLGCSHLSWK